MRKSRFVVLVVGILLLTMGTWTMPARTHAQEPPTKAIFLDTFYGMAAGALIGSAISLAQDDPKWGKNIGTAAAIGGIAGALFGIVTEVSYMVEVRDGRLHAGVPALDLRRVEGPQGPHTTLEVGLVRVRW